mmetsp:Transcript_12982/g.49678  ORF Transcript_12982/g.49678 Transcript_12982/m.49678 type:complete len:216 (-) Transcript_12982:96-743(-)
MLVVAATTPSGVLGITCRDVLRGLHLEPAAGRGLSRALPACRLDDVLHGHAAHDHELFARLASAHNLHVGRAQAQGIAKQGDDGLVGAAVGRLGRDAHLELASKVAHKTGGLGTGLHVHVDCDGIVARGRGPNWLAGGQRVIGPHVPRLDRHGVVAFVIQRGLHHTRPDKLFRLVELQQVSLGHGVLRCIPVCFDHLPGLGDGLVPCGRVRSENP